MSRRRVARIVDEQPADREWFRGEVDFTYGDGIPRSSRGARWYEIEGDDADPISLVECADGAVFTHEDIYGEWS